MLYLAVPFSTTLTTHLSTHRVRVELSLSVYQEPVSYQVKYLCLLGKSPLSLKWYGLSTIEMFYQFGILQTDTSRPKSYPSK